MNSPGLKTRLFSDDGIDASRARSEPQYVYFPDESTYNDVRGLFNTLKSFDGTNCAENALSIKSMPFSYDLAMLSCAGTGDLITLEDVANGMCRIATHFIATHDLIQSRANAYIRCKLAGAESVLNGIVVSQNEQAVERDQILLSSMTVPPSPREGHDAADVSDIGQISRSASLERIPIARTDLGPQRGTATPPMQQPPALFRSPSVHHEQMNSFPVNVFALDDETLSAALNFLPDVFEGNNFVSRKSMSSYDADKLQELWEFFDHDDDGIVTRDDLLLGVSNIAKNYICHDSFTQLLAHAYVQRKIRRALFAIRRHQQGLEAQQRKLTAALAEKAAAENAAQDDARRSRDANNENSAVPLAVQSPPHYQPGDTVVYTDEEGNNHVTKVIRLSNRSKDGGDTYYIETKGVRLAASAQRLRALSAQDYAALGRYDQPIPSTQAAAPHTHPASHGVTYPGRIPYPVTSHAQPESAMQGSASERNGVVHLQAQPAPAPSRTTTPPPQDTSAARASRQPPPTTQHSTSLTAPAAAQIDADSTLPTSASTSSLNGTPSKGGIFGYLKSSILGGIGGAKPSTVVPQSVVETQSQNRSNLAPLSSNLTVTDILSLDGAMEANDSDSVFTNGSLYCAPNAANPADGRPPMQSGSTDNLHMADLPVAESKAMDVERDGPASSSLPTALATPVSPDHSSSFPASLDGTTASEDGAVMAVVGGGVMAQSASQRLRTTAAILQMDGDILAAVAKVTTGSFKLLRNMVPKPKKIEPYPIYFNRGKNGFFEFNQVDFGVVFTPFLRDIIPMQDGRWQTHHDTLSETNRCFFLHFGVAMGLHPLALQQGFRQAAAELLKFPENEMTIFFGEALESLLLRNDFVDAQVLSAIWPLEFDRYKVLIVRVDHNGRIESFTSFRSELGPVDEQGDWAGEEVIFTLQWNHFTILKPKSEQLNKPITAVLAAASMIGIMPLEFVTKVDADPAKRFRLCSRPATVAANKESAV